MTIHVVQPGETIQSISQQYKIPVDRLILENGITNPDNLAIGQTIVIVQPEILYTVQAGDTLVSIAKQYNVSPMEILRNNPYLSYRQYIYTGEVIVIQYQANKTRTIATSGYIFPYVDRSNLIKTLPFLSYLTIFNYRATDAGEILVNYGDETELVQLAVSYGVAPMMFVSTITKEGVIDREVNYKILNDPLIQDRLVEASLQMLKKKGYYGINLYVEDISFDNIDNISNYLKKASEIFHAEGYRIVVTVTPVKNTDNVNVGFERLDYSKLADYVDGIIFAAYDWARTFGYPSSIFPATVLKELLDYAVNTIPSEKIFLGLTTVGYDWKVPYVPGVTEATVITNNSAIEIAANNNIPIEFNEEAQSPYFYYSNGDEAIRVIWFKDARSFNARAVLVEEYDLQGLSLWTIMIFDAQLWFIINNKYYIEKLIVG